MDQWHNFESGDSVCAPDRAGAMIEQAEILRPVATGFQRVIIDWTEGDRWVERRIAKAVEVGHGGFLLEAEHGHDSFVGVHSPPPLSGWFGPGG